MKEKMKYRVLANIKGNSSMKLLYGYLLDCGEAEINISHRQLGKEVGMKKSTVGVNLRKLRDIGAVKIKSRYADDGARLSNKYIID